MAQRDDRGSSSRRIFLAWMMALPVAGGAAAQTRLAWRDEYDPTQNPTRRPRSWLDEVDQPPAGQTEANWRDEYVPEPEGEKTEVGWRDEHVPEPPSKQTEVAWPDEYVPEPPSRHKKLKQMNWRDEIDSPPKAKELPWRDEIDQPPPQ
jgi:hypothetical protein